MKKSLLLVSAALFAMAANAQVAVFATQEIQDELGLNTKNEAGDKVEGKALTDEEVAATPLVTSEVGDFYLAFADTWKAGSPIAKYPSVKINGGEEIALSKYGAVGNTNPTFVSYQDGAQSAGAVFRIEIKADGWVTVFTKLNANKQFVVMENKTGALPYTLGYTNGDVSFAYTQPMLTSGEDEGYIDFSDNPVLPDGQSKYFVAAQKQLLNEAGEPLWKDKDGNTVAGERPVWTDDAGKEQKGAAVMEDIEPRQDKPQFPWITAGLEKSPGDGSAFMSFNVLKGNTYYVSALGSKVPMSGFIFTEDQPTVTFCGAEGLDNITFVPGEEPVAAVETVSAASFDENAPIYNAQGVRVNADAKGLLIQNGKKFIRK